jgi:hypothetical protein
MNIGHAVREHLREFPMETVALIAAIIEDEAHGAREIFRRYAGREIGFAGRRDHFAGRERCDPLSRASDQGDSLKWDTTC